MDDFAPTPKKNRTGLIIAIIVILLIAGGGYYFFNVQTKKAQLTPTPTPTFAPTEQPTETPTSTPSGTVTPTTTASPTVRPTTGAVTKATELNVQVLNGSGTVGAAGEVRDHLTSQGYKNVDTGNADNFNYTKITINIKDSRKQFLTDIQDALKDKYTLGDSGTLSADSNYDVVIIVGK
jgi:hypothetical protein